MQASHDVIRGLLHSISVEEVEPSRRYHCKRCNSEWSYVDGPQWWQCPTPHCTDWMTDRVPVLASAKRRLSGLRPADDEPEGAQTKTRVGRPPGPKVPPDFIKKTFQRMRRQEGRYPADKDLADALEVSLRTIFNYRAQGHLPARPANDPPTQ